MRFRADVNELNGEKNMQTKWGEYFSFFFISTTCGVLKRLSLSIHSNSGHARCFSDCAVFFRGSR